MRGYLIAEIALPTQIRVNTGPQHTESIGLMLISADKTRRAVIGLPAFRQGAVADIPEKSGSELQAFAEDRL